MLEYQALAAKDAAGPQIMAEREQLAGVMTSDKEVKVVIEMPGVTKVKVRDISLEVTSNVMTHRDNIVKLLICLLKQILKQPSLITKMK
jgi:hypothetical protein